MDVTFTEYIPERRKSMLDEVSCKGRLRNKIAIVTGAGSSGSGWGNGKATAVLFARAGAKIFAVDLHLQAVEETKQIIVQEGGECTTFVADVSNGEEVRRLVDACIRSYGSID